MSVVCPAHTRWSVPTPTGEYTSFDTEGWVIDPPNGIG
jgi:hypothetical protein